MESNESSTSTNNSTQLQQEKANKANKKVKKKFNFGYQTKKSASGSAISLPTKLWRKFIFSKKQSRINKRIDKELKKDFIPTEQILILGVKGSGKTTICKQIRQVYGNGFSDEEKRKFIKVIEQNLYNAIMLILSSMTPDSNFENSKQYLLNYTPGSNSLEFFGAMQLLWKDSKIQSFVNILEENEEIVISKYFFKKLNDYCKSDYLPSLDDILHCYETTCSTIEIKFKSHSYSYNIVEIPNLKCDKHMWKHVFSDISFLVYVVNCSSFDKIMESGKNYLEECIEELNTLHKDMWIKSATFVVFLNQIDQFCRKIQNKSVKLEKYFPEYSTYEYKTSDTDNTQDELSRAKSFIKNKFLDSFQYFDQESCGCIWYCHYTCALNSDDLQLILNECTSYIGRAHSCRLFDQY